MEYLPSDESLPLEMFDLFSLIYTKAESGTKVSHMGFTQLAEGGTFLGHEDHVGFLYLIPSFQVSTIISHVGGKCNDNL